MHYLDDYGHSWKFYWLGIRGCSVTWKKISLISHNFT